MPQEKHHANLTRGGLRRGLLRQDFALWLRLSWAGPADGRRSRTCRREIGNGLGVGASLGYCIFLGLCFIGKALELLVLPEVP